MAPGLGLQHGVFLGFSRFGLWSPSLSLSLSFSLSLSLSLSFSLSLNLSQPLSTSLSLSISLSLSPSLSLEQEHKILQGIQNSPKSACFLSGSFLSIPLAILPSSISIIRSWLRRGFRDLGFRGLGPGIRLIFGGLGFRGFGLRVSTSDYCNHLPGSGRVHVSCRAVRDVKRCRNPIQALG